MKKRALLALGFFLAVSASTFAYTIPNPLPDSDAASLISRLTNVIPIFTIAGAVIDFLLVGMYMVWTAMSIEELDEKKKKAQGALLWGVLGLIVVILAPAIPDLIGSMFGVPDFVEFNDPTGR